MPAPVRKPMTSDEFIAWAMEQPDGERILHGGPLELDPPGITVAVESFFP